MAQSIFGGMTSYDEQSLPQILENINFWIEYTNNIKKFIEDKKTILVQNSFWNKIPYNFSVTINSTIMYTDTILSDLNIVKKAIESNLITEKEIILLNKIGIKAIEYNHEYGKNYKENYEWRDYGNKDFEPAEEIYEQGRDYFVTMQDCANASHRLEDYMEKSQVVSNTLNLNNVSNTQIQQGVSNSAQSMNIGDSFDYQKVLDAMNEISKYIEHDTFKEDFGDKSDEVKTSISEIIELLNNKEEPSKIKKLINNVKDTSNGVVGSLIASGIVGLISNLQIPM